MHNARHCEPLSRGQILAEGDYASVSKNPDVITAYLGTPNA